MYFFCQLQLIVKIQVSFSLQSIPMVDSKFLSYQQVLYFIFSENDLLFM